MTKPVRKGTYTRQCRRCGWCGTYTTAGLADGAKRRHSCSRWTEKAAKAERNAARLAAVDRTPKPCAHPQANHRHGTRACYVHDRCRCEPCAAAVHAYETNRVRTHAYGRWDHMVDAGPVRLHVAQLMDAGMGLKRIARRAGVSTSAVGKLIYGRPQPDGTRTPTSRVRTENAEKLLAVTLELAGGARVARGRAHGLRLRLQALVALGYSQARLAHELDTPPSHLGHIISGQRTVNAARAHAICALYERLSMTVPTTDTPAGLAAISRARRYAADRKWLPPLALDDDLIDVPGYDPTDEAWQSHEDEHPDGPRAEAPDAEHLDDEVDEAAVLRRLSGTGRYR